MVQKVAMHVVRRTVAEGVAATKDSPGKAPETEDIQPGTLYDFPDEEVEALEAAGAIVDPTDKRAAKFGFGTAAAVQREEGETADSAAKRRKAAQTTAAATPKGGKGGKTDPLLGKDKEDLVG